MPLNRHYTPSLERDGIWYKHHSHGGVVHEGPLQSTTNKMLYSPFCEAASKIKPGPAPEGFRDKEDTNYKTSNRFSQFDNRFAVSRLYYPEGRKTETSKKFYKIPNYTDRNFLKHFSRKPVEYSFNTHYRDTFEPKDPDLPTLHRRFQRNYPNPAEGKVKLNTTTTDQFQSPDVPYTIPWRVMTATQHRPPKENPWKLSYQSMFNVPYDHSTKPVMQDRVVRYGPRAFYKQISFCSDKEI